MERPTLRLPIYARQMVASDHSVTRAELVFCPREGRTVDASHCRTCAHANAISSTAVECSPPVACLRSAQDASHAAVGAVASAAFTCVDGDLSLEAIGPLLPDEPWVLPVVDSDGRFAGFVSRTSADELGLPPRLSSLMRTRDLAVGHALAIAENRSLRDAVEELALRHARSLAIVDSDGTVRGLLTDLEALRAWAALRDGR